MIVEKPKIILIESDMAGLKQLETQLSAHYAVTSSYLPERAITLLRADSDVKAIVVATGKGVDVLGLLNVVRHEFPAVLRVLLTAFEDLTQIVEGLHSGAVHRVVSKPLKAAELLSAVPAIDAYHASHSTHAH